MASVWGLLVLATTAYAFAAIEEVPTVPSYLQKDQLDNTAEEILSSEAEDLFYSSCLLDDIFSVCL